MQNEYGFHQKQRMAGYTEHRIDMIWERYTTAGRYPLSSSNRKRLGSRPHQCPGSFSCTVGCHRYLHPPWRPTPPKPPNCMLLYRNTKLLFLLRFYTFFVIFNQRWEDVEA